VVNFAPPMKPPPLRGIILRDTRDTVIVQADADEVARFAAKPGTDVRVEHATMRLRLSRPSEDRPTWAGHETRPVQVGVVDLRHGQLYDVHGRPVAVIRDVRHDVNPVDVTTFGDVATRYLDGLVQTILTCTLLPGVRVET
jgi:hypothetical protein